MTQQMAPEIGPALLVTKMYDFNLSAGIKQTPLLPDKLYAFTYLNSSILPQKNKCIVPLKIVFVF